MRKKIRLTLILLIVTAVLTPMTIHAAVVGHFTQVRGQVGLLKKGNLPALPAKIRDGVEPGDVIRTKAGAKAQLTMVDDSVITLAPESRLAIADYTYNPARMERRAVIRLFRGLVQTVVNRIIQTEEPDFIMETHTAIIGVRGTDWYTLLGPNYTLTALRYGTLFVKPTVAGVQGILLHSMQFIQSPKPFLVQPLTPEMLRTLEQLMDTGLVTGGMGFAVPSLTTPYSQFPPGLPGSPDQRIRMETIPPKVVPPPLVPPPAPSPGPTPGF